MLIKVAPNSSTSTATSNLAAGVDWAVTNKNMDPSSPIEIISMSFGGGKYYTDCPSGTVQTAFDNAKAAGIIPFVSAGNSGYNNALGSPGCDPDVVGVGSVFDVNNAAYAPFSPAYCYDSNRQANERICYSNASPALDLYAPSEDVVCPSYDSTFSGVPHSTMRALGGTSSAAPAAAGSAAQILQAKPQFKGDFAGLLALMQATGDTVINSPNPTYQNKRVNVEAACQFSGATPVVNSFTATPSTISTAPIVMASAAGTSTLSWTCGDTASVTIGGVSGSFPSSGSTTVSPVATTTYTLTANGPGGTTTAQTTVTVTSSTAAMSVSPTSKDFGSVATGGTSAAQTVTVTNTGSSDLMMGSVSISGTDSTSFAIQSDGVSGVSIPPSGMRTFDVVFGPATMGSKSATVNVPANAGSGSVAVSGTGGSGGSDLSGMWVSVKRKGSSSIRGKLQVTNTGASATSTFTVDIYFSGNPMLGPKDRLVKSSNISLAAGQTKTIKVKATDARDPLFLIGDLDSGDDLAEGDETNNRVVHQTPSP